MSQPGARTATSLRVSQAAAASVVLLGLGVLLGWVFNIAALKSVLPNLVSMVPNTAVCLLSLGVVLWLRVSLWPRVGAGRVGWALTLLVPVVSGLTLLEYLFDVDVGIDQLLFLDNTRVMPTEYPGRMAPITAISLMLSSLALWLVRWPRLADLCALVVLFFGALATTGYLFDVSSLYQVIGYTSVAAHTAFALVVLSLGILASRPTQGMLPIVLSDTAGGEMARRLLWMMPLLLVLLDWLVLQGERAQFYDGRFGLAVSTVSTMAASWGLILLIAHKLHVADTQRQHALLELAALNNSLERKVTERTLALTAANERLAQEILERKQAQERVHRLSLTDELSGLLNRRGFCVLAEQALKTARRVKTELALVYIDLDGLKRVNDELGHQAGDAMIVETANLLKASFRESDLVARMGGDEFAILAVSGDPSEFMLERLRKSLAQFNKGSALPYPLSFSVGSVRCLPQDDKSLLELLADADARMYLQKQMHREAAAEAQHTTG